MSPDETTDLDRQLRQLVRRSRRVLWGTVALIGAVMVGAIIYLAVSLAQDSARISASCHFAADLGAAPVTVSPSTGRPSLLGVRIISDSRVWWHGQRCAGVLPPPAASFRHWATFYKLPVG